MSRSVTRWLAFTVALMLLWPSFTAEPSFASGPERLIVVFSSDRLPANAADLVRSAGGTVVQTIPEIGVIVAEAIGISADTLADRLRRQPGMLGVGPDIEMKLIEPTNVYAEPPQATGHLPHPLPTFSTALPADFFYTSTPQQWAVKRIGAQGGGVPGGTSPGAWDVTFGAGAKIAILDTGVSPIHPDTAPNLIFNFSFTTPTICDDGSPVDQHGHGTWTASLAAGARGTGTGLVIGVAPAASILNVKVLRRIPHPDTTLTPFERCRLGGGSGLFSWVLGGIVLAAQQDADVISMSLGGFINKTTPSGVAHWTAFLRATNFAFAKGSVIVASAGNSALRLDNLDPFVHLPSELPNVISVTATTNPALLPPTPPVRQPCAAGEDCLAFYSNFGSSLHGLAAPGGDFPAGGCAFGGSPCFPTGFVRGACSPGIPGTIPGLPSEGKSFGCFSFTGEAQHAWYVQAIGTSASAPLVAGAAALVRSANPGLRANQVRAILQQTAQDIGKVGYDALFNYGLVRADKAVGAGSP